MLDDGRLTDGQGRTVDFRNTVLLMTSNLGASHILDPELSEEDLRGRVMADVRQFFRPEFLNRIDETVIFHRLTPAELHDIVRLQLERLQRRLDDRDLELEVTEPAVDWLAERGYDPVYGARPLQRVLRTEVENALARAILADEVADGATVVVDVRADGEALELSTA